MKIEHLNDKLYTNLPIDELDGRLAMEELEDKLELSCWVNMICTPPAAAICEPIVCFQNY